MTVTAELTSQGVPLRLESRQSIVHVVEYSRYPRRDASENRRVGYTQDRSDSGLGLDLPETVSVGELLRVCVRDIDGQLSVDGLARVVWCKKTEGERTRAGVAMLREKGQRTMMRVRGRGVIAAQTTNSAHPALSTQ
jgi:hypothetical protein